MPKKNEVVLAPQVPMRINGTVFKPGGFERKTVTVDHLWNNYLKGGRVNLHPAFQRLIAWTTKQRQDFLASCFNKMSLPPIYLMKRPQGQMGPDGKWVWDCLDALQRLTTFRLWFEDSLHVPVKFYDQAGKLKEEVSYSWSAMKQDDRCFQLVDAFLSRDVDVVVFNTMSIDDARRVFVALNSGSPLNTDEHIYCPNYLTRKLCDHVFGVIFADLKAHMSKSVREGDRFKNIRPAHDLLLLCCGCDLKGECETRSLQTKEITKSAQTIHDALAKDKFTFESPIDDDFLHDLGIKNAVHRLRDYANALAKILNKKPNLGLTMNQKTHHPRNLVDPLYFLYWLGDEFEPGDVATHEKAIIKWLSKYHDRRREESYDMTTTDYKTMIAKFAIMDALWKACVQPNHQLMNAAAVYDIKPEKAA